MAPGARSNFGVPMFEPEVFRKQMYSTEESTCNTVGIFGVRMVIRRPGNFAPLPPSLRPFSAVRDSGIDLYDTRGVTRLDGAQGRCKFDAPIFESEVLWKQIYCIEGSICDIVRNFRRPPQ